MLDKHEGENIVGRNLLLSAKQQTEECTSGASIYILRVHNRKPTIYGTRETPAFSTTVLIKMVKLLRRNSRPGGKFFNG